MDTTSYSERTDLISNLKTNADSIKSNLILALNQYIARSKNLLNNISNRDNFFKNYINMVNEFDNSDRLTAPSDLFPGIRTAAEISDIKNLAQKTEIMKRNSEEILNLEKKIEQDEVFCQNMLKRVFSLYQEYLQIEHQIYDMWLDLAKDMNSIYDIGQIAGNS